MSAYFFDTSALVKRYITEPGSEWVITQCRENADNNIIISHATLAEAVTAFCRRARTQSLNQRISEPDRDRRIKLFREHAQQQYHFIRVTKAVYAQAGDLCRTHKLRAYDAIQLVCALHASDRFVANGKTAPIFVSADTDLLNVAVAEGLDIMDPNAYC